MKKITACALIPIVSAYSFSQQNITAKSSFTKTNYMEKSRNQKTAAWLLLSTGVLFTAIVIASPGESTTATGTDFFSGASYTYSIPGQVNSTLVGIGLTTMLSSIPFFIAAGHNKRKAVSASTSLKMEKVPVIEHSTFVSRSYPVVSLKISIK